MEWFVRVWQRYAEFEGRSRRKEYWMFHLINTVIWLILIAFSFATRNSFAVGAIVAAGLYGLAGLIPGLAVSVRRLHDIGRSGWWLLIALIPFGGLVLLVFDCLKGTPGPNEYGPDPKAPMPWPGQPMSFR